MIDAKAKEEIRIINEMVEEAVDHGADFGGAYFHNYKLLKNKMQEWIDLKGFSDAVEIRSFWILNDGDKRVLELREGHEEYPQIVEKGLYKETKSDNEIKEQKPDIDNEIKGLDFIHII